MVPGFFHFKNFASPSFLMEACDFAKSLPWNEAPCPKCELIDGKKQCVSGKSWLLYSDKRTLKIQAEWDEIRTKLPKFPHPTSDFKFSKIAFRYYPAFSGLSFHRDCAKSFTRIAFISLSGKSIFSLKENEESHDLIQFIIEPGDLVILSGDAFFKWFHQVENLEKERYVILFGDDSDSVAQHAKIALEDLKEWLKEWQLMRNQFGLH